MSHQYSGAESGPSTRKLENAEPERIPDGLAAELSAHQAASGRMREFFPDVPVVLDGEAVEDLERMNAELVQPLFMTRLVYDSSLALGAFTNREAMLAEARRMHAQADERSLASALEAICTQPPDSLPTQVCFFEDINEGGDVKCVDAGLGYPDLSKVHRGFLGTQDWNFVISSLSQCRFDVSLFDLLQWHGDEFFQPKGCNTPDLGRFRWNDLAVSIANWGT
ncbi:hypothetical protein [Streptomyces roseoverticillatus]|uniref:hypothetical protein n=1 Tax=Streptomyces roseoverticillatus TaxID=66429 RepID=UPI0012FEEA59|nr:hypothetical protein [Streptomyces roseoverticillatus]